MTALADPQIRLPPLLPPPPAPPRIGPAMVLSGALATLSVLLLGFVADVSLIGHLRETRDQRVRYATLRNQLANATAPVGPVTYDGRPLAQGAPIAVLEIPSISVKQVVVQGSTSRVLVHGPGHRVDTPFPGQPGLSVIYGRRSAFGGPFAYLGQLRLGQTFTITTGQGVNTFRVLEVRRAGDPQPPPLGPGGSRVSLITAAGSPYLPEGLLIADADLISDVRSARAVGAGLSDEARPLAADRSGLAILVLWGQLFLAGSLGIAWVRHRFGLRQAWLLGVPILGWLGVSVGDQVALLLPNLT